MNCSVTLSWEAAGQVSVDKIYRFRRGRYDVGLEYRIRNLGAAPYSVASYLQVQRLHKPPERSYFNVDSYSYTGPMVYDGDKYEKLDLEDLAEQPLLQAGHQRLDSVHPAPLPGCGRTPGRPGNLLRRRRAKATSIRSAPSAR